MSSETVCLRGSEFFSNVSLHRQILSCILGKQVYMYILALYITPNAFRINGE